MPPKAKAAGRGRGPAKRKLAEEFPPGEVLTDTMKRGWKLGAPVGQGGFGLLYLAEQNSERPVGADARYVVKVEPSENGPLFSELHFYMRAAKPELIQSWMRSHKNQHVGVPRYWGSGLHQWGGQSYRFMVIDRLGTDLQKKLEEGGGRFPRKLVLQLGLRLLDTLEFIHEHEYVHADIKASNLMLSHSDPNQVYLVDYGLAYRYAPDGVLKEYKEDPKRCHDGTMEFTSLDAHRGASACRRSDLEILGYCLVRWLCGRLPWEDRLQDPLYVRDAKIRSRDNIPEFMSQCFPSGEKPGEIQRFLEEVKALGYQDTPPYQKLRGLLLDGLKSIQAKDDGRLDFGAVANGNAHGNAAKVPPVKKTRKRKMDPDPEAEPEAAGPTRKKRVPKPAEASRQKKSPKTPRPRKRAPPKAALVETGTQTTPGLAQRTRARKGAP